MILELQKFRAKYPEYDDLDDLTLATKLGTKYPEYNDLVDKVRAEQIQPVPEIISPTEQPIQEPQKQPVSIWKEAPIKTIATFGKGLLALPKQVASKVLMATQGIEGASVTRRDWGDKYIDLAEKDSQKFIKEVRKKYDSALANQIAQLPQNLAYSLTSMGAGLVAGAPFVIGGKALVATGVGAPVGAALIKMGWIAGTGASGVVAYRMTTYEIMQEYLELKNEEMFAKKGTGITFAEEQELKKNFNRLAKKYGLWEAIPEAISNLAFVGILTTPLTKIVGKTIAGKIIIKVAGLYGEELATETVTEMGQKKVRAEAGFPEAEEVDWASPSDWLESLKSIAPQTFLLTTVMAGAGGAIIKTKQAVKSLKQEIGEGHSLYKQFEEKLEEIVRPEEPELIAPEVPVEKAPVAEIPETTPEKFVPAITKMKTERPKHTKYLTWYSAKEYKGKGATLYLTADKKAGYGLTPEGELISLFSLTKGKGSVILKDAITKGAKTLDCTGEFLEDFYSDYGFETYKVEKNRVEGEPDVYYMQRRIEYEGRKPEEIAREMGEEYRKKEREGLSEDERKDLARTMGLSRRRGIYKRGVVEPEVVKEPAKIPAEVEPKVIPEEIAKKRIKPRITEITGVKKIEKPVVTTEMTLLKTKLKAEARGAKAGERIGRIETKKKIYTQLKAKAVEVKELRTSIIDYANENLTKVDRDRVAIIASKAVTKHRLARAVTMIDKMEEKYQRHVAADSLKDTVKEIDFKRLRPEYKAPMTAIADSIDLVNRREKTIKGLVSMYKYIQREPNNNIPQNQLNRLATLTRTPIKEMTTDDITLIDIALKSLVKQHELKGKLIIKGKIRDFVKSRDKAVGNVRKKELADVDPREGLKVSRAKQLFTTDAVNAEHITKHIDKEEHGVIKEILYDNMDNGVSEVLKYEQEANDYFWKDVGDVLKSDDYLKWDEASWTKNKRAKNVDYQTYKLDSGKTFKITKEERICIELDSRNENNLRRMLEGGYRLRSNPTILYKITTDDLTKIKQSLTPKEKRVADARYKYFNTIQKDKLNKKSVELNGWEVAVESDYFPMADRIYGVDIHKDYLLRNEALPSNMRQFTQSTLEGMGLLKERVANINPLILESAATITYKSIKQTATYYGLAEPLRSAKTLLFDPTFKTAITTRYGSHYWQSLANYIRDMEGEYQRTDNVDKMILGWINKLDVAVLGMNPFVMAKQPISLMAAAVEMDSKYVAKALKGKPETKEVISKHSPQLRDRLEGNVTRELGEIAQTGQVRRFWTHKHTLSQSLMSGIKRFDYEAVGRIWKAVEYETNELHPNLTGEAKMEHIAQRTEEVVRLTQPTFHIKDRSAIGRSRSVFVRLATKYTSQRNKNYMMILRTIDRYNNSNKGTKAKRDFMKGVAIVSILMPLMLYGIDELRNWLYKRKPTERKIRYRILKFMEYNLGNVYFVGNLFRSFVSKIERGEWFGYGISDIVTSTGEQSIKAILNTYNAIDQTLSQERYKSGDKRGELKWKTSAIRAVNQAMSFATRIRGIPYDTIRKLIMIPFREPEKKKGFRL